MSLEQTSDRNDEMRAVKPLAIAERMPQPRVLPMPSMSDNELYLRVGIPDGLENNGSHAEHYGIVQQAHMDPSRRAIKSDSGE